MGSFQIYLGQLIICYALSIAQLTNSGPTLEKLKALGNFILNIVVNKSIGTDYLRTLILRKFIKNTIVYLTVA